MNTPSPALLRRALKAADEIEKLDQQIHELLAGAEKQTISDNELALAKMTEKALAHLSTVQSSPETQPAPEADSKPLATPQEKQEPQQISPATAPSDISISSDVVPVAKKKNHTPSSPAAPHHEQQSFLIDDDATFEKPVSVTAAPLETQEKSGEEPDDQSCCLF